MKKLCVFDLDGTVLDTVTSIAHYANYALRQHGIPSIDRDEYRYLAGDGARNLVHRMLQMRGCDTPEIYDAVFQAYNQAYDAEPTYLTTVFPGLADVLDRIKKAGIRISIVSNKPDFAARSVVEALYGKGYFEEIIGQREGVPLKPDPTAVLTLAARMGYKPEDCIYIGDTSTDMRTGKNAGMYTVGVLWGFRDREELLSTGADVLAETPEMLYEIVTSR